MSLSPQKSARRVAKFTTLKNHQKISKILHRKFGPNSDFHHIEESVNFSFAKLHKRTAEGEHIQYMYSWCKKVSTNHYWKKYNSRRNRFYEEIAKSHDLIANVEQNNFFPENNDFRWRLQIMFDRAGLDPLERIVVTERYINCGSLKELASKLNEKPQKIYDKRSSGVAKLHGFGGFGDWNAFLRNII